MNPKFKVLVIEDEASIRSLVQVYLEIINNDCEVVQASNSTEVLQMNQEELDSFNLILSDIDMPGINGLELTETLHYQLPATPIFLMSGKDRPEVTNHIQRGIIVAFLQKPFTISQLEAAIKRSFPS